jgi:hypothetical protein
MWIASFDIGMKNFSFVILNIIKDDISLKIPLFDIVHFENLDIRNSQNEYTILNLVDVLDSYKTLWDDCQVVLIEQQMQSRHASNIKALKISQHVLTYFTIHYKDSKKIIEYPSYYKTQIFNAPKMTKYERKKWSVNKVKEILKEKCQEEILKGIKKVDDICDNVLMILTYIIQQRNVGLFEKNKELDGHVRLL